MLFSLNRGCRRKGPTKCEGGNLLTSSGNGEAFVDGKDELPNKLRISPENADKYMSCNKCGDDNDAWNSNEREKDMEGGNHPESSPQNQEYDAENPEHCSVVKNCTNDYPLLRSPSPQPLKRIPSLNNHNELKTRVQDSEEGNEDVLKQEAATSNACGIEKRLDVEHIASAHNVWRTVNSPDSCYPPLLHHPYTSASDLDIVRTKPTKGKSSHIFGLETNTLKHAVGQSLLDEPASEATLHIDNQPDILPYLNHELTELSTFSKEQSMLPSYPHHHMKAQKHQRPDFAVTNDQTPENGQFPLESSVN